MALDDFNRADGGPGASYASWLLGGQTIVGNQLVGFTNEERGLLRIGEAYGADQAVEFTVTDTTGFQGAIVRGAGADATRTGYAADCGTAFSPNWYITRYIAGVGVNLASGDLAGGWPVGTVVRVEVIGSTISLYRNGVLINSAVDATHATGAPGLYSYSTGAVDNANFLDLSNTGWNTTGTGPRSVAVPGSGPMGSGTFAAFTRGIASAVSGFGLTASLADQQDQVSATLTIAAAGVGLTASIADQRDTVSATLAIAVAGFGLTSSLADQSDGISSSLSVAAGLSAGLQDRQDVATASLSVAAGLSAGLQDAQDTATSSLTVAVGLTAGIFDAQDGISASLAIGSSPMSISAALLDGADGVSASLSATVGTTAAISDANDRVQAAFSAAVSLSAAVDDASDRVQAVIAAAVAANAALQDETDRLLASLSITPIGGISFDSSLFDENDAVSALLSITDAPSGGADGGDGGSAAGPAVGGLLHKYKLAHAFKDKREREEAVSKLPQATQVERVVLRRAAAKLLKLEPVNYKELETRVSADLVSAGLQVAPHHLDWLLYFLRVGAYIEQQRLQAQADEEAVMALLLAVMEA